MPTLSSHQSGSYTKLLLIGDSGTGKTGALVSLVRAGYNLRILDYDNGLDSLVKQIKRHCPDRLDAVDYETLRDKRKASPVGPIIDGPPKAFVRGLNLLDKWSDGSKPAAWGPQTVLVLDSLTMFGDAGYDWANGMNPGAKDKRQIYFAAQEAVESVLALLSSIEFKTNVVVISHVRWIERPDGTTKGYPSAIGGALSPKIPTYFNSVALCQTAGTGNNVRRTIQTAPTALIDLKNPAPFAMLPTLPIENALADFFKAAQA